MRRRNIRTMSSSQPSSSRLQEYLGNIPPITLGLLGINIAVHALFFLTSWPINDYSFVPLRIIYRGEIYRIVTSAFIHGGLFHIAMNMMSLIALGGVLESGYGSVRFLYITLLALVLTGVIAIAFLYLCAVVISPEYLFTNAVGYSGVLFSYALIESFHAADTMRSVMGMFSVPTKVYPFVLLLLLQFILPNISFSGHLSGILAGIVIISGLAADYLIPSHETFERIEPCMIPASVRSMASYRPLTTKTLVHPYFDSRSICAILYNSVCVCGNILFTTCVYLGHVIHTVLVIVGCPVDSMVGRVQEVWRRLRDRVTGLWVGPYQPLPTADTSAHGIIAEDVESPLPQIAEALPTPSAPPLPPSQKSMVSAGSGSQQPQVPVAEKVINV